MKNLIIVLIACLAVVAIAQTWSYENGKLVQTTVTESTTDTVRIEYSEAELIEKRLSAIRQKHDAQSIINTQQDIVDEMNGTIADIDEMLILIDALKAEADTTETE